VCSVKPAEEKGSLRRKSFICFPVEPGRHSFLIHWNPISGEPDVAVSAQLEANKTYYFDFGTGFGAGSSGNQNVFRFSSALKLVDLPTGRAMTKAFKPVGGVAE